MRNFTPQEIVSELDKYIISQSNAKKAVSIALRNRWRRRQISEDLKKEIIPKNILMIGSTGIGKTEIARRIAKLDNAPFIKVEATKFTEVGYVGRDVESIIRDLVEISIKQENEQAKKSVRNKAEDLAVTKLVDIVAGESSSTETRNKFREKIISGVMDNTEIEVKVKEKANPAMLDINGNMGQVGMISIDGLLGKEKFKTKKMTIKNALKVFMDEESENLVDRDNIVTSAIDNLENNGIVFIDEIDKIASSYSDRKGGADVSREGVQRDLLPLVEGTSVTTKYGPVNTDHILFIASGAFSLSKPADLLPELQGRFPIRVELNALTKEDFKRILTEPKANLILQSIEMLKTEDVTLSFEPDALDEIAEVTAFFNETVENIGARRLHTVVEKILEEINYEASNYQGKTFTITKEYVKEKVSYLKTDNDLSKFII